MNLDGKTLAAARSALREAVRDWIYDPNVRLIDFGMREKGGSPIADDLTIRVHVAEKLDEGTALEAATQSGVTRGQIPKTIGGFRVTFPKGPIIPINGLSAAGNHRQVRGRHERLNCAGA